MAVAPQAWPVRGAAAPADPCSVSPARIFSRTSNSRRINRCNCPSRPFFGPSAATDARNSSSLLPQRSVGRGKGGVFMRGYIAKN